MRISDVLKQENVHVFLRQTEKEPLMEEMVELLMAGRSDSQRAEALREVRLREEIGSTGIGEGVAIPHATLTGIDEMLACLGITTDPVAYDSIDGQPVRIFVLVLGPRGQSGRHLRFLARVARLLKKRERREALLGCRDAAQAWAVIEKFEEGQIDA
jgi:PTS system nitrogen regulatory IIA component